MFVSCGIIVGSYLGFAFAGSTAPLPDCGTVATCAQKMIELVNIISEENKSLARRVLELEREKEKQAETNKTLKDATTAEAIAKAALSALEFVVRHDNSQTAFNEASCEAGEKLVGGSCVGGSPQYNPGPPGRLGDGGQAAVGPLFTNEQGGIAKLTLATKVVCRAYGDPNMQVTANAVCARLRSPAPGK